MSGNLHGFFVIEEGRERFVSVQCWRHLELPHLQLELARQRYSATPPYCACHGNNQKKLEMHVRHLPRSCRYTLYRTDPAAHAADCWTSAELGNASCSVRANEHKAVNTTELVADVGPSRAAKRRFLPTIFLEAKPRPEPDGGERSPGFEHSVSGSSMSAEYDYFDFDRYVGHCCSFGQVEAFCRVNANWRKNGFRQPTILEIAQAIEDQLGQGLFSGENGFAAAKRVGCVLGFGLLGRSVEAITVTGSPVYITMLWFSGGELHSERAVVPECVWAEALRGAQIWGRYQSAPYLCFASSQHGQVRRLRLFPAYLGNNVLAPCDSGYERAFCAHLVERGCAFLKPLRAEEVGSALRYLDPEIFGGDFQVRYRPDFLVFQRSDQFQMRCWIVEVRGMKLGKDPEYDTHLITKQSYYQQLSSSLKYAEKEGWGYQEYKCKNPFEEISGMPLKILPDPEAVRMQRETLLSL